MREFGSVEFEDEPLAGAGHGHGNHAGGQLVLHAGQGDGVDQIGVAQQLFEVDGQLRVKLHDVLIRVQRLTVADNLDVTHGIPAGGDEQGQVVVRAGLDRAPQGVEAPPLRQQPGEIRRCRAPAGQHGFGTERQGAGDGGPAGCEICRQIAEPGPAFVPFQPCSQDAGLVDVGHAVLHGFALFCAGGTVSARAA